MSLRMKKSKKRKTPMEEATKQMRRLAKMMVRYPVLIEMLRDELQRLRREEEE